MEFPNYDKLPLIIYQGKKKRCAWGLFDKDGKKDVFGCLNKVTPDVVANAASEVKDGITISLNCPLRVSRKPGFGRKGLTHKVISFVDSPLKIHGYDDEVEFNTQCSSQWDALCSWKTSSQIPSPEALPLTDTPLSGHFYDQDLKRGYNDANPSIGDLVQEHGKEDHDAVFPTLNHWHIRGGLATRGVLIDYKAYADRMGIQYSPFSAHKVTVATMDAISREQGVVFQRGDILILRTGYMEALQTIHGIEEQEKMASCPDSVGVEDSMEAVKWCWNHHFSAVAADNPGFEVMRPTVNGIDASGTTADYVLHPNLLALLGIHIGELWDLKRLSEYCHKTGRFSFLLTSMPLNVPGACGSPPNAMALF